MSRDSFFFTLNASAPLDGGTHGAGPTGTTTTAVRVAFRSPLVLDSSDYEYGVESVTASASAVPMMEWSNTSYAVGIRVGTTLHQALVVWQRGGDSTLATQDGAAAAGEKPQLAVWTIDQLARMLSSAFGSIAATAPPGDNIAEPVRVKASGERLEVWVPKSGSNAYTVSPASTDILFSTNLVSMFARTLPVKQYSSAGGVAEYTMTVTDLKNDVPYALDYALMTDAEGKIISDVPRDLPSASGDYYFPLDDLMAYPRWEVVPQSVATPDGIVQMTELSLFMGGPMSAEMDVGVGSTDPVPARRMMTLFPSISSISESGSRAVYLPDQIRYHPADTSTPFKQLSARLTYRLGTHNPERVLRLPPGGSLTVKLHIRRTHGRSHVTKRKRES